MPISPSTRFAGDPSAKAPCMSPAPATARTAASVTTREWPRLNARPTPAGLPPSETNLRVELSIAEMWSQS